MDGAKRAEQFILKHVKLYEKINVINLSIPTDKDAVSKHQLEYKFICSVQEHINLIDQTIVILYNDAEREVLNYLSNNGYNHIVIFQESRSFVDYILKHCNNIFIGKSDQPHDAINAKKILISLDEETALTDSTRSIYGVYFVCCYGNYINVIKEQFAILVESGLYQKSRRIYVFVCMCDKDNENILINTFAMFDRDKKVILIVTSHNLYERFAMNNYKKYIKDESPYYLYYFHTKGVSRTEKIYINRRQVLNIYTLFRHELNVNLLNYYDAVGCNLSLYPKPHFSGNFWWARSEYLMKLKEPIGSAYLAPEMYVCSERTGRFISLCQTANQDSPLVHINKTSDDVIKQLTNNYINNISSKNLKC